MTMNLFDAFYIINMTVFNDFGAISKRLKGAFKWHKNHKNPIRIDDVEGVKLINRHSTDLSFDGFVIRLICHSTDLSFDGFVSRLICHSTDLSFDK